MKSRMTTLLFIFQTLHLSVTAQQIPDTNFKYEVTHPIYPKAKGPVIILDEAHLNFHTLGGRYSTFGDILENDGYVLKPGMEKFTETSLHKAKILVIANPLGDTGEWKLPTRPAFTNDEVMAVEKWVNSGGRLFIIADHMPCSGAAANLAAAFGFNFINGFAFRKNDGPEMFSKKLKNLADNPITKGRNATEKIDSIQLFTGSAFLLPPAATVITNLDDGYVIELASVAWEFNETTPKLSGRHFVNGAMLQHGAGRVVVFGEAAMFSAQLAGPEKIPMGMNQESATQNPQLLLNIIHWLDGKL
jgi:hypothetical protein